MGHDHDHHDTNGYYLEQLFTIAVCGALAAVTILLWYGGQLKYILADKFHIWVLLGALLLLALVIIRAVAVWQSVEPATVPAHDHDHDHAHEHGATPHVHTHTHAAGDCCHEHVHDHDHGHEHAHGHDHSHGWAPWRFVVLLLPVVLYFLIPMDTVGADDGGLSTDGLAGSKGVASKGADFTVGFTQLEAAAQSPEKRDYLEGKTVRLEGMYVGDDSRQFTLERLKVACCRADAVKLNALIMVDPGSKERLNVKKYRRKWVRVTGRVEFLNRQGTDQYVPALILHPTKDEPLDKLVQVLPGIDNPLLN